MSGCNDKRFEKMLYAYELGMLSEEEREQFELHLYECEHCFERARKFSPAIEQIRHNPRIQESVRAMAEEESAADSEKTGRGRFWQTFIPIAAAAVLALLVLLVRPFGLDFKPSHEAIAYENRLAIMYFENMADPTDSLRWSEVATNLLITDLSESAYLQVMSGERLADILRLMNREDIRIIDKTIAMRIAKRAEARWIVMGNILQTEPTIILTGQLIDVRSGNIEASQKVVGETGEDIFSLIDQLTVEIRHDLGLPDEALAEEDRHVADVTTHSTEAYRHYLEGKELYQKFYNDEAIRSFEKALDYDSTLAMAYYYLASLKDPRLMEKAVKYSDYASQIDRYYIKSLNAEANKQLDTSIAILEELIKHYPEEKKAHHLLGRYMKYRGEKEKAAAYLEKAIEIDPLYKFAVNELAYLYNSMEDFDRAIESINRYIELAPDEANPYDSRGDIYSSNGMLKEAIESYEAALERKPDFYASLSKLGELSIYAGEFERADSICAVLMGLEDGEQRIRGIFMRAMGETYRGDFEMALASLEEGIELVVWVRGSNDCYSFYQLQAHIHEALGEYDKALEERRKVIEVIHVFMPGFIAANRHFLIQTLALSGDLQAADKMTREFYDDLMEHGADVSSYQYARGNIEFVKGNYDSAAAAFEKVNENYTSLQVPTMYMLGRSYQMSGQYDQAIATFEKFQGKYSNHRLQWGIWSVKSHYYLGLSYQAGGNKEKAIEHYNKFLNIWQASGYQSEELKNAAERLKQLVSLS